MANTLLLNKAESSPRITMLPWKAPWMYVAFIAAWLSAAIYFNPRVIGLFRYTRTFAAVLVLLVFTLLLNVFWFFGIYNIVQFVFSLFSNRPLKKRLAALKSGDMKMEGRVAILYSTMNDFKQEAAMSCLEQDYPDFHLYILDDSRDTAYMQQIDRFAALRPGRVTVIRREDRKGFKAGNLNNALKNHVKDCPYILVVDSDQLIEKDFIKKILPYFKLHPQIGFVQAGHLPTGSQESKFAKDLNFSIIPLWTTFMYPRNVFGFVPFLGHGAVIRRDVWEACGGFPEIVSEDLAFATGAAEKGYFGYFAGDVTSYEDFPESYQQFKKQQKKYVMGYCEFLHHYAVRFLKARGVSWFEKLDVLIPFSMLLLPAVVLLFMLVFSLLFPIFFAELKPFHLWIHGKRFTLGNGFVLREWFSPLWQLDYNIFTYIIMFSPVLSFLNHVVRRPLKSLKFMFLSAIPYYSRMTTCTVSMIQYMATGKTDFTPTHMKTDREKKGAVKNKIFSSDFKFFFGELVLGVILTYFCLLSFNIALLSFSLSVIFSFVIFLFGWDRRGIGVLKFIPFSLLLLSIAFVGFNLVAAQGLIFPNFTINF